MLLNIDHKIDENFTCNNKILQLLMSDKAFNPINEEQVKEPENVIRFLTESMSDLSDKNKSKDELEVLEKIDFIDDTNIEISQLWSSLLEMIANFSKWLTYFAKGCPGFHVFDNDDLSILVASSASFLFCVRYRKLAKVNDQSFLILANNRNILLSREKSLFFSAENIISISFLFYKILNELELTECELALLYPVVLLGCDANLVKDKEYLIDLRSYYVKSLLNQFRINNRDEHFSRKLNNVSYTCDIFILLQLN
jgi:hypothetical protein